MRKKESFNDNWTFHLGEISQISKITPKTGTCGGPSNMTKQEGFSYPLPKMLQGVFPDEAGNQFYNIADELEGEWSQVTLPHDWNITQKYEPPCEKNTVLTGKLVTEATMGYLPANVGYYRKRFSIPSESLNKRIVIEFEGTMRDSIIWINGCYIGSHLSGYTGYAFDISEYLNYGSEGDNIILVKTDSSLKEGWWCEGAGIYRDVWLYTLEEIHIKRHGIFVYTEKIIDNVAYINIETDIINESEETKSLIVEHSIVYKNEPAAGSIHSTLTIPLNEQEHLLTQIMIDSPNLWCPEHPSLYTLETKVYDNDGLLIDSIDTTFGIRTIQYTDKGLLINNLPYEIKGVCAHQDFAGVGIGLTHDIINYRMKRIKEMGANAYRSAHHPATDYLLEVCDREGILVLNENRRLEVNPEGTNDLEELILSSRNHPSIFMWSLENEEFITIFPLGQRLLKSLIKKVKRLDPTRQVTVAGQFAKSDINYMSIPDVAGFNYDNGEAAQIRAQLPGKLTIASEDSSFVSTRGIYQDDREAGYVDCYDSGNYYLKLANIDQGPANGISTGTIGGAVSPSSLTYAWSHYKNDAPYLGGIFLWTAFDYRGETFPWNWPTVTSHYGAMDYCGFAKDLYYYYQSLWLNEPVVHLLPHWNWNDSTAEIQIDIYSNCDELELFCNEQSLGKKMNNKNNVTSWSVKYRPGALRILAYNDGELVAQETKSTSGTPKRLLLTPEYEGKNEVILKCSVLDDNDNLCPTANLPIVFSLDDHIQLVGVGNGNPASHESDKVPYRTTFNGLAMIIVKRGQLSGNVTACCDKLISSKYTVCALSS